jgi:thiamine biosynthesis lipoprotein
MIAHPLADAAMATSGDYRNRFQSGGVRYSHTIDPRTGSPIRHALASVSVIANTCMAADAWATAINVLGPDEGMLAARERGLDVMLVSRRDEGFAVEATGDLEESVEATAEAEGGGEDAGEGIAGELLPVLVVTTVAFGIVLAAMAVGVIFGRRSISGSCGGLNATTYADGTTNCSLCGSSTEGCQELRDRLDSEAPSEMEPHRSHQSVS